MNFKVVGLDHIVLRTSNTKKMLHFYCDILGCAVEKQQSEINLTQVRIGENLIDLVEVNDPLTMEGKNLEHFCLRINPFDYESLQNYFQKHDVALHRYGERYSAQGYGWSFYIFDPEGNEVELTGLKK